MEIQSIIDIILNNFNFGLIISINVLVYTIVKFTDFITKNHTPKWLKIVITIFSAVLLGFVYWKAGNVTNDVILSSCISAPLIWDWIIKPILNKFGIDYKTDNYEKEEKEEIKS